VLQPCIAPHLTNPILPGAEEKSEREEREEESGEQGEGSRSPLHAPVQGHQEEEEEGGDQCSVHSCDTEGYYTTFHDFDGFQVKRK
jgi:hypothetical protein